MLLGALPIPENVPSLQRAKVKLIITLCEPFELDFIYSEQEFKDMGFVNKRYVREIYELSIEVYELFEVGKCRRYSQLIHRSDV